MAYKMNGFSGFKSPSNKKQKQINEKVKGNKDSAKDMINIDKGFPSSETFGPDRDFRTNTQIREKSNPMTTKALDRIRNVEKNK